MKSATVAVLIAAILNTALAAPPSYPVKGQDSVSAPSYQQPGASPAPPQNAPPSQPAPPAVPTAPSQPLQPLVDILHLTPQNLDQLRQLLGYFQNGNGHVPGGLTAVVTKLLGLGANDSVKKVLEALLNISKPGSPSDDGSKVPAGSGSKATPGGGSNDTPGVGGGAWEPTGDDFPKDTAPDGSKGTSGDAYKAPSGDLTRTKNQSELPTGSAGGSATPGAGNPGKPLPGGPFPGGQGGALGDLCSLLASILHIPEDLVQKILLALGLGGGKGPLASITNSLPAELSAPGGFLGPVKGGSGSAIQKTAGLAGGLRSA